MTPNAWHVLWVATLTDLATGLGALPFAFVPRLSDRWQGRASALAGGMMLSASVFTLADRGLRAGSEWSIIAGMLAGAAFFAWTARLLESHAFRIHDLSVQDSRRAALIIVAMAIHSFPEGIAIGVGYATGELQFGILLAVAIGVHNVPEGMAVALPLRTRGVPVWKCAMYAILTSVPQPIAAVPAFLLMSIVRPLLPIGLGFAGGAMIFLVVSELVPDSLLRCTREETAWAFAAGLLGMLAVTSAIGV
jgi:zinc transporter ZupT